MLMHPRDNLDSVGAYYYEYYWASPPYSVLLTADSPGGFGLPVKECTIAGSAPFRCNLKHACSVSGIKTTLPAASAFQSTLGKVE